VRSGALAIPNKPPTEGLDDAFFGGGAPNRQPGGGPAGRSPLVRTLRAKQPEMRRVASAWHSRFDRDPDAAIAEVVSVILVVADVPTHADIAREDVQDRDPSDVVQQLVASLALEASEKGADFSQHWLVSHERGAQRVRENFPVLWKELVASASTATLLKGLFARLRDWTLALSECQFRSIRHVATVAALHLAEGLWAQCSSLSELCGAVSARSGDDDVSALLSEEQNETKKTLKSLSSTRDALGLALLSRRTKDVDSEIRRECFEALRNWLLWDKSSFLQQQWSRYFHFGLCDREPKVRASVLSAIEMLLKDDPSTSATTIRDFVEQLRPRLLPRCHDVEPAVAAGAIRCVSAIASRSLLNEEDFDPVVDLVWHPEAARSLEATTFVCRFVFSENILDYATPATASLLPTGNAVMARRRICMLLHFLAEYSEGHFHLIDRLVASLWRRTSALEDWESIASMALPGGDHTLVDHEHVALLHLAESIVRHAAQVALGLNNSPNGKTAGSNGGGGGAGDDMVETRAPAVGHAEAVLERAWRALSGRLPSLFAASKAQPEAMRRAASLCRFLLAHGSRKRRQQIATLGSGAGLASVQGKATAEALKEAFVRQPDPDTLEFLAEGFAHLLDLSAEARPILLDLVKFFLEKLMKLIDLVTGENAAMLSQQDVPAAEALLAVATRLRILAKAVDVSMGQVKSFFTSTLGLLDDRAEAIAAGEEPVAGPLLAVTLLELLVIILMRHVTALLQPSPLPHCVMHDPVNPEELQITPTAARDFCKVATALLDSDPAPFVRASAFAGCLGLLSAWANAVRFTEASRGASESSPESPWLPLEDGLANSLCNHLAAVLMQANAVPPDCGNVVATLLSATPRSSPFSLTFDAILKALPSAVVNRAAEGTTADAALADGDRVKMAVLAGSMVASCHHPDVADSNLPAVVLTQAYSNREDLQKVAWDLLSRLRKDAHAHPESGSAFFKVMMHAAHMLHRDAGIQVASELSTRLLQRTCVGKLIPGLQMALMAALQAGIRSAVSTSTSPGFLEALVPWVTKHIMDDVLLLELAAWTEAEAPSFVPEGTQDVAAYLEAAGVPAFVEACRATAARGTKTQNAGRGAAQKQLAQGHEPRADQRSGQTTKNTEEGVPMTEEMTEDLDPTASVEPGDSSSKNKFVPNTRQTPKRATAVATSTPVGGQKQQQQNPPSSATATATATASRSLSVSQSSKRRRVSSSSGPAPSQSVRRQPVGPVRTFGPDFSQP